jgi:Uma2 family endonuclease
MIAAAKPPQRRYTPAEYLELERTAEFKSEYVDGQIYAMAGASPQRNTISANTTADVVTQLRGRDCQAFGSDQKVSIPSEELFTYPDLSVVCGEPRYHDEHSDVLLNPRVIVEILSPSTEGYDRGAKFARYEDIETFTDYILVSQFEPRIEHYVRQPDGNWLRTVAKGRDAELEIASIGCVLRLRDIYDRIDFSKQKEGEDAS